VPHLIPIPLTVVLGPVALAAPADDEDVAEVVVVSATRTAMQAADTPTRVEVIDRETIEATGAESLDDLLQEQPGLQVDRTVTGASIRIQGMAPEHTLILIDGQRVLGRKDGVIDLARIAVQDIERVEITKGPSSALYGSDAMGGVIHIITRKGTVAEAGTHMRLGLPGRIDADADVTVPHGKLTHRLSAGWHSADAWDRDPSTPDTDASAFQQRSIAYKLTARPSPVAELTVDGAYQQRDLQGVQTNGAGAYFERLQIVEDARASVRGWVEPVPNTRVTAMASTSVYRDQFLLDQHGAKDLDSTSVNDELLAEGMVQLDTRWRRHALTVGMDGLVQALTSDRLGVDEAQRARGAVFVQDVWTRSRKGRKLIVSPGVRYDVDTQFGDAFIPRLAVSHAWQERFTLRGSLGVGYRAPDFRELFLLFENPGAGYLVQGFDELEPERSRHVDAGFDWAVTDDLNVTGSSFYNAIDDLIDITPVEATAAGQLFTYANTARARTAGGELGFRASPGPVQLGSTVACTHARDLVNDRPLPNRSPWIVTGVAGVDATEDVGVRAQANWSSPRVLYVGDTDVPIPSQLTLDVRGNVDTGPVELFAGIDNLLDDGGGFAPLPPRFVYAGFTARTRLGDR
jgi:outer membrane receptor for ferrienterochelin and colicins